MPSNHKVRNYLSSSIPRQTPPHAKWHRPMPRDRRQHRCVHIPRRNSGQAEGTRTAAVCRALGVHMMRFCNGRWFQQIWSCRGKSARGEKHEVKARTKPVLRVVTALTLFRDQATNLKTLRARGAGGATGGGGRVAHAFRLLHRHCISNAKYLECFVR